uniref:Uncharacterized protein n=1 Tax=Xiphophorus couchianus TaxID=32473 RepID=A0A3B5L3G4_9TELE
ALIPTNPPCTSPSVVCPGSSICIKPTQMCDGTRDYCVLFSHVCDGEIDCMDGSDEEGCQETCDEGCGQCISEAFKCDGYPDCHDHSDEAGCPRAPRCPAQLQCPHSHECLQKEWLCDGEEDCKDGSDENVRTLMGLYSLLTATTLQQSAGRKSRAGAPAVNAAVCRCPKGLLLSQDRMTCVLPKESSFILLLSHNKISQVEVPQRTVCLHKYFL